MVGERTGKIWSYNVLGDQIVEAAAVAGLGVLEGEPGDAADLLRFMAAANLAHVRQLTPSEASSRVAEVLSDGSALRHFSAAVKPS